MSPVESCRGCGRLFSFLARGMCADCIDARETRYRQVREWLLENRGSSILEAAAATGVEEALIMEFVREGRLEFVATAGPSSAEEEIKARIRRDLAAREAEASAAAAARSVPRGMRSRSS